MKTTISVVIPVYNEVKDIVKCLDSLMCQTTMPNEIIVVDNNSTDDTIKIVSTYKLVKIIKEKHKGITYARTAGFNAAKCDIIARIDADTIAHNQWVESILAKFSEDKAACGLFGRVAIRELSPGKTFLFSPICYLSRQVGNIAVSPKAGYLMAGHNMAIRKTAWDKVSHLVNLGDKNINEDVDISLFIKKVGEIKYCHNMLVKTRMVEMFFNIPKIARYARTNKTTFRKHQELDYEEHINFQDEITTND